MKKEIRKLLSDLRKAIPAERRVEAKESLVTALLPRLQSFSKVLSFCSTPDEIDLSLLNEILAEQNKLVLPKVEGEELLLFNVKKMEEELMASHGQFREPNPTLCRSAALAEIECILVPGLGFDRLNHRIGYGKGHYDRLLLSLKKNQLSPVLIGVAFSEQLCAQPLPIEEHDQSVSELLLV